MLNLRTLPLLLLIGCPAAEPSVDAGPAIDAGFDAGPVDAGRNTIGPNPCGCTGLQTCDPTFLDCIEPEECELDEDCRGDRICVRGGCYDCWGDEMAACVGGQLCSGDGECQSAGRCTEDYDCIDGLSCSEEGLCGPPAPCDQDELEPNNHPLQARRIGGVRRGLWTCAEGDWYTVRQRKAGIAVLLRGASGPIEPANMPILTIFDGDGRRALATGALIDAQVRAELLGSPVNEDLLLHIMAPEPLRYDLSIQHSDSICPELDAEPNHAPDQALLVSPGMELRGSLCPRSGDEEDLDFYRLEASAGQHIGYMVEQGGGGPVELSLRDEAGNLIGDPVAMNAPLSRGLLAAAPADGPVYAALRGSAAAYRLRLGLFPEAGDCEDDASEPDDQAEFATPISNGSTEGVLCPGSIDHFSFDAAGDDGLHLVVEQAQSAGVAWVLQTPGGNRHALAYRDGRFRLDRPRLGETGRYLLIGSASINRDSYRVDLELVPGGACQPDAYDPADNDRAEANELRHGQSTGIYTACDDADWFRVELPAGHGQLRVRRFTSSATPMSMELFEADADLPLASTTLTAQMGALDVDIEQAGTYFIRILGDRHETLRYQIMAVGAPPSNDSCANPEAIRLNPEQNIELTGTTAGANHHRQGACGGGNAGDVQYFVQVPAGGGLVRFELQSQPDEQGRRHNHILSLARQCLDETEILCDDNGLGSYHDRLEVDLEAGIYVLTVDNSSSFDAGGPFQLLASVSQPEDRLPYVTASDGCGVDIATIPMPEGERGTVQFRSSMEGLSDSAEGSCGFSFESRDAFFAFELSAPASVRAQIPNAGRSVLYLRPAACTLPVDLACNLAWRGDQDLNMGRLAAGRYVLIYDRMTDMDGPFTISLTLSDP